MFEATYATIPSNLVIADSANDIDQPTVRRSARARKDNPRYCGDTFTH